MQSSMSAECKTIKHNGCHNLLNLFYWCITSDQKSVSASSNITTADPIFFQTASLIINTKYIASIANTIFEGGYICHHKMTPGKILDGSWSGTLSGF